MELIKIDELPDKPLCSPSKESIMAALYPDEHEYTYYVLDSTLDGTHRFTSDEAEYNALLAEYEDAVKAETAAEEADAAKEAEENTESEGEGE